MKKSPAGSKFNANLVVIGIVVTMLMMIATAAGADNGSGVNVPNITVSDTQITSVSQVPASPPMDIVAVLTTQTQNAIAALTAQPTAAPPSGPTNLVASTTTKEIVDIGTSNAKTGIVSVNGQFYNRESKRIPQSQKLAAAADYKAIREAYLLQGNLTAQKTPGGFQTAGYSIAAVPPTMDPGGIPHYFGPFPNYANSPMPMGNISNITVTNGGTGYAAPIVTITDAYFTGSGATATAAVSLGVITNITITNPGSNYTAPVVVITDATVGSSGAEAEATLGGPFISGIRKFVDTLPGLNAAGANNLGNYIPVAIPNKTAFPGSDYYEIELGQFTQKMHSDLPNTTLRGYRQTNTVDPNASGFHYLGPVIIATTGTPVRVKFTNSLPVGAGGNLFIPVDTTVPGAGMGPLGMNVTPIFYTQNRATLHLHGGTTPWISDGTPDQWITPANESTGYPKGVSVYNVPDMPDPGIGSQTFFYTNQQSARLMFYHDHAAGITRLNVYAGEAAGYLITDPVDTDMIAGTNTQGINPTLAKVLPDTGIPLVIQDKTFVDARTIAAQDPTWNWGTTPGVPNTGDLWWPHVYMTAENPGVRSATNPYGRWFYGPWFFPPTPLLHPPIANPYFGQPGEPPQIPGTPNPSAVGEAFMDTPLVNGVAYPNVTVLPQAYRFRILSAADDRFFNLQWYVADANVTTADGRNNTEVRMVAASPGTPGFPATWPTDGREGGVPDPATRGPSWIQIGSEGGFLPAPVVIPPQPITYVTDPTRFDFGNADKHSLLLAAAERADVIVDFSQYAGKTLILYNDAPAAFPAGISQYDYYTGAPDRTSTGGAPSIIAGYGPNVRTVMQVKVANTTPAAAYNVATLNSVFAKGATKRGVFEVSQPPIIIPQAEYTSAYNQVMPVNNQNNQIQIQDNFYNFTTIFGAQLNITFQPKALHDEMGAVYDEYGRMSGMLGLELPSGTSVTQTFTPYPYASPPTDVIMTSLGALNGSAPGDGTQIWKITHNGVDTHPLHWHMYNVQVISRAPWDGLNNMAPDPNELGWKETIRVSPLEDTYIALRPVNATVPFAVPDNVRAIDPTMPLGITLAGPPGGFFDTAANGITVPNHLVNFGWEYVWHCHILSHEEMDMMHSQAISVNDPGSGPTTLRSGEVHNATTNTTAVFLVWNDQSNQETDWLIQRTNISQNNWTDFMTVPSYTKTQTGGTAMAFDSSIPANTVPNYSYRVLASNVVGDDFVYAAPSVGFPTVMRNSSVSNVNISQTVAPPGAVTFVATPTSGFAPLNVSFTGTSAGATGWSWDFGDGNWAGDNGMQNPNHIYQLPGTYTVTLTAMTTGGNTTSTQSTTITVSQTPPPAMPVARFTANQTSGIAPLVVAFDATTSTSAPAIWATWRWSFGDGTFSSLQNPTHTYVTGGNYTVSLVATNLGGTSAPATGSINVTGLAPVANFTGTPTTGAAPLTVRFTDLSTNVPTSWNWTFGDGNATNSTIQNPVHTFLNAGSYAVSLNASNSAGSNISTRIGYINVTNTTTNLTSRIGVYQNGQWILDNNGDGAFTTGIDTIYGFGGTGYTPVVGDWNGSSLTKIGVYQNGQWILDYNGDGVFTTGVDKMYGFGGAGYTPVVGDWNANNSAKIGVYQNGQWILDYNGDGVFTTGVDKIYGFGGAGYTPVVGDWNGDKRTKIGVFQNGLWILDTNGDGLFTTGVDTMFGFGGAGYTPVVGDWNGDNRTEIGVFQNGLWVLDMNGDGLFTTGIDTISGFGGTGYTPVVGDWDGNNRTKIGIFQNGLWVLDTNGDGLFTTGIDKIFGFGGTGYTPLVGRWN